MKSMGLVAVGEITFGRTGPERTDMDAMGGEEFNARAFDFQKCLNHNIQFLACIRKFSYLCVGRFYGVFEHICDQEVSLKSWSQIWDTENLPRRYVRFRFLCNRSQGVVVPLSLL